MTSRAAFRLCCEWPGLMISVKATAPFKRDLKNLGLSLMDQKTFSIVAGVIFAAVALFHLVRIYMDWPVMIGGWSVPMWVSWIGLVVAGGLAFFGLKLAERDAR
jgi:hypothetical protein